MDILLVGFEDGTVHLSAYNVFDIGTFVLPPCPSSSKPCRPLMHCSHPLSSTHALIATDAEQLVILPLDLCLISDAGRNLPLLASKTTQLQTILQYLRQVQRQLCNDFKTSQDLAKRFIRNIEEELSSKSDSSWVQSAYHLVVTGDCQSEVKDWLIDQLGERVGLPDLDQVILNLRPSCRDIEDGRRQLSLGMKMLDALLMSIFYPL